VISTEIKDERICSPLIKQINEIIPHADEKRNKEQIDGNILTFYSTTRGYLAWENNSKAPFQILCDLLKLYGYRLTFDDILLDVKDRVEAPWTYPDTEVIIFCESIDNNRKYIRFTKKQNN
jgi:hypothetical protein